MAPFTQTSISALPETKKKNQLKGFSYFLNSCKQLLFTSTIFHDSSDIIWFAANNFNDQALLINVGLHAHRLKMIYSIGNY
jgi:regulatory protein YycH of two-component signal transduction system YycFG